MRKLLSNYSGTAKSMTKSHVLLALRLIFICALVLPFVSSPQSVEARSIRGYSVFYVPGDEADLLTVINDLNPGTTTGPIVSRVSIVSSGDDVQVYLDEWEDGYDLDLADPHGTADAKWDIDGTGANEQGPEMDTGDVLTLYETDTFVTGSEGVDGGDRIYVTGAPVSIIRSVWADVPGPVLAGAWELYPVNAWQTAYTVPVGEDTNAGSNPLGLRYGNMPFNRTHLFIQAESDGTVVTVDNPNPGDTASPHTLYLDQGDNAWIDDVYGGTTVSANHPVQAMIATGRAATTGTSQCPGAQQWDGRFFTLTPEAFLGQEYYVPLPSLKFPDDHGNNKTCDYGSGSEGAYVDTGAYIYAFEDDTDITIEYMNGGSLQTENYTLTSAGDLHRFVMPRMPAPFNRTGATAAPNYYFGGQYGARISADKTVWVLVAGDDALAGLDWGFQTINTELLASEYFLPHAIYNPIHMTPVNDNTTFYIDYNNDGTNDVTFTANRFDTRMVYPNNNVLGDYNMAGTHVYADGPFAISWGQDHSEFSPSEALPDQDWGYTVLPLSFVEGNLSMAKTANPETIPGSGGTVTFQLVADSATYNMYNLEFRDYLPSGWSYVNDSTTIDLSYDTVGPYSGAAYNPTGMPGPNLVWDLSALGLDDTMPLPSAAITLTFQASVGSGSGQHTNNGEAFGTSTTNPNSPNVAYFRPVDYAIVTQSDTVGTVHGHLYMDFNGNGTQDADEPNLTGVDVVVTDSGGGTTRVTTDSSGNWSVTVPAGATTANVDETDPDYPTGSTQTEGNDPTTVTAIAGASVNGGVDGYYLPRATIGDRVWLDENGDGVQDAGEDGIANVTVALYKDGIFVANTTTDIEGRYIFPDLAPGTYAVIVDPSGTTLSSNLHNTYDEDNGTTTPNSQTVVTVGDNEEHTTADFGYNWVAPTTSRNPALGATGALGDRIWNDADGDGRQDPGEAGIANVTVRLLTDDNGDGVYGGSGDNPATTTTTDAAGNYIFDGLAPDAYVVQVNDTTLSAGFTTTPTGDPDGDGDNTSVPIVIGPGDVYVNADFGYNRPAGSTIGDTLFIDADANGTQDAGEPGIPGVTVSLLNSSGDVVASTMTDADGKYLFPGLPAGTYTVKVTDTYNVLNELDQVSDPDGGNDNQSTTTVDGTSDDLDQDFGYAPDGHAGTEGLIGDTIFLDRDGSGTYEAGEGLEGVTVYLYDNSGTVLLDTTTTNENGQYFFGGLSGATYQVHVGTSTLPNGGTGLTNSVDPDGGNDNHATVTISTGGVNLLQDFGYTAGTPNTISGTIWEDADANGTLGSEVGRFAGVTVALYDSNGDVVATTITDGSGNYSFPGLPDGTYTVSVTDDDNVLGGHRYADGSNDGADNNSQPDTYNVSVSGGAHNSTADFGYYRDPAAIGNYVWEDLNVDGIQGADEPGIAGAVVTLQITYPNGDVITVVDVTDADGHYSFSNLLLDEDYNGTGGGEPTYVVSVATPVGGYAASPQNQTTEDLDSDNPSGETASPVQGTTDNTYDFGYYKLLNIGDRVWLDLDGDGIQDDNEPGLENVIVELDTGSCTVGSNCPTDTTDANGNYLFADRAPGTYRVVVRASSLPGGVTQTGDPDATMDGEHTLAGAGGNDYLYVDFGYQGTGSISDYVWNDMNGDGVQDASETGIGGVNVWVDLDGDGNQDANEPGDVTEADGSYYIGGLPAGTFTVRTSGSVISGANATFDLDGAGTANVTSVTLSAGQNRTDVDFGYQYPGLSISKSSSANGTVNPGDTVDYTIIVRNNTGGPQTGIAISDPLPAGTTYVAQSTVATGYVGSVTSNYTLDEFATQSYSRQDGDGVLDWATDWIENDPWGTAGPVGDYVGIAGGRLSLHYAYVDAERIERAVNLSSYSSAELRFDWETVGLDAGECIAARVYDGSTWTTLTTFTGSQSGTYTADITSYISNNTRIRFANEESCTTNWENGEYAYFDNVRITGTNSSMAATTLDNVPGGTNPDLVNGTPPSLVASGDNLALNAGQSMQVTFQVTVNDPAALYSIDNTACVISAQQTTPACDTTSDVLPQLGAIGDYVWVDEDGDGEQDAGEPGISNATVDLYDPGADGMPGGGDDVLLATTTTDTNGKYLFPNLQADNYFVQVRQLTLPANLVANPTYDENGIGTPHATVVVLASGVEHMSADFGYNWSSPTETDTPNGSATGAIGDRVWIDADGDGVQDAGEAGIANVTVSLLTDDNGDGVYGGTGDNPDTTTTTDAAGNYIFDGLVAGTYQVRVNGGNPPAGYAQTGDPDQPGATCTACDNSTTSPIVLAPGDVYLNADFGYQLTSGAHTIGDTIFIDADGDGTEDAGEPGIPGVSVALLDAGGNIIATDITDSAGQYSFPGLPDGNYTVWVNDTANVLAELTQTADPDGGNDNRSGVALSGANNLIQDFGYAPAGHDSGEGLIGDTIFIDRDGGNDYDAGEGVEGVVVHLYDAAGTTLLASTTTNENGQYSFGGLGAATYQVHVDTSTLPGGGTGLTNSVDPDGGNDSQSTVALGAGEVNLLQDFGYAMGTPNTISGTLWEDSDADGRLESGETGRFNGVTVVLYDDDGNVVGMTTTDVSGNYSFTNLPDGIYTVDVTDDAEVVHGYWKSDGPNGGADNNSQDDPYTVSVAGGQTNTTADFGYYRDPAAIGNFVWLDVDRDGIQDGTEPGLSDIQVTLYITYPNSAGSISLVTTTDANGYYSFDNLLFDEDYNLTDGTTASPDYTVVVDRPNGTLPTTENAFGSTDLNDADGMNEDAMVTQGTTDLRYDFGFVSDPFAGVDLGDMPDTASLTRFGSGAAHLIFSNLSDDNKPETADGEAAVWLGAIVDVELDGVPTSDTSGDGNDEDGLQVPAYDSGWTIGQSRDIVITLNSDQSGVTVYYGLWIDWNGDADFDDPDDMFFSGSGVTGSPVDRYVSVTMPASYIYGTTVYFRARAFTSAPTAANAGGTVINGEVEDYNGNYATPTSVNLASFAVEVQEAAVLVTWETASELDNVGFNVYRSQKPEGPYTRLNDTLIPVQNPGSTIGAAYAWLDADVEPGVTYYYKLEDVDVNGAATLNGPVSASIAAAPTAVDVQAFAATSAAQGASLWMVVGLVAVAGSPVLFKRRRK